MRYCLLPYSQRHSRQATINLVVLQHNHLFICLSPSPGCYSYSASSQNTHTHTHTEKIPKSKDYAYILVSSLARTTASIQLMLSKSFCKDFIHLFLDMGKGGRKRGRETLMWERNIDWLSLISPKLGTKPATQACALTRNWPSDFSLCPMTHNQLSHLSRGSVNLHHC